MRIFSLSIDRLTLRQLQTAFLSIRSRITRHARIYFRRVACMHRKADCIAEVVGLCWKWFLRLAERGKDAREFPSVLATYAARAVCSGRRLCGQEKAKDAMSPVAQHRHGFYTGKLPDFSTLDTNPLAEALAENTVSPVPEQVVFRIDFPNWLTTRTERDRRLIERMAMRERTTDLARKFGLSESRVSQLRQDFYDDWNRFGEEPMAVA